MSTITVTGTLSDDPDLRYTSGGIPVCTFRVGEKLWRRDKGADEPDKWTNYSCKAWNQLAENISASLVKGDRMILTGHFEMEEYTASTGDARKKLVLVVDDCGPELRFATCEIEKNPRKEQS